MPLIRTCSNEEFWDAIKSDNVENLRKLEYTLNQCKLTTPSNLENMGHFTPLQWCVVYGYYELMQELIKVGVDVNAINDQGITAAILAVFYNRKDCLELLIKAGANLDIQTKSGKTAAMWAAYEGHEECLELLRKAGANLDIQIKDDKTAVISAAYEDHKECLELLIKAGAKLDIQTKTGWTAVMWAASKGHKECLDLLIKARAKLDIQGKDDKTAAMRAAANGRKDCLELLIKAGVKLDIQTTSGKTAVMWAASKGYKECLNLLIKARAKLDIQDKDGKTAVMWAASKGHKECLELLIKAGANLDIQTNSGKTAAMWAAHFGYTDCRELLIGFKEKQATVKSTSGSNNIALSAMPATLNNTNPQGNTAQPKKLSELDEDWRSNLDVFFCYRISGIKQEPSSQDTNSDLIPTNRLDIPFSFGQDDDSKRLDVLKGVDKDCNICFARLVFVYRTGDKITGYKYGKYVYKNYKGEDQSDTHVSNVYKKADTDAISSEFVDALKRYHPEKKEDIDKVMKVKLKFWKRFHHSERAIYKDLEESTDEISNSFSAHLEEKKINPAIIKLKVTLVIVDMLSTFYQCKWCKGAADYFQNSESKFLKDIQANFSDKQIKTSKKGLYSFHRYAAVFSSSSL